MPDGSRCFEHIPQIRGACVDVGCGRGIYAQDLLQRGADFYVGVDLEPALLLDDRQQFLDERIHFVAADAEAVPFKDSSFSLSLCSEVIEHVVNPGALLAEICRVLREGRLVMSVLSLSVVHALYFKLLSVLGRLPPTPFRCCGPGGHLREYAAPQIDSHFEPLQSLFSEVEGAGFMIVGARGAWVVLTYLLESSWLLEDPFRFEWLTRQLVRLDAFLGRRLKRIGEFTVILAEKQGDEDSSHAVGLRMPQLRQKSDAIVPPLPG